MDVRVCQGGCVMEGGRRVRQGGCVREGGMWQSLDSSFWGIPKTYTQLMTTVQN